MKRLFLAMFVLVSSCQRQDDIPQVEGPKSFQAMPPDSVKAINVSVKPVSGTKTSKAIEAQWMRYYRNEIDFDELVKNLEIINHL